MGEGGVDGETAMREAAAPAAPAAAAPAATGKKHKSCILLWMDGGPSHKETFDLKPGSKSPGEFKPIKTSAPGVQISEHLPQVAAQGHRHLRVSKSVQGESTHSAVQALDDEGRIEELARMLGGREIGKASRANARQMLAQAAG